MSADDAAPPTTVVGSGEMASIGSIQLIGLLLACAFSAAAGGFIASAVRRPNKRRARRFFMLGFFCGSMATATLRGRRRVLKTLGALGRSSVIGTARLRSSALLKQLIHDH